MSKPKCSLVKRGALKKALTAQAAGPVVDFQFIDNEDDTCTVVGVDAAGNPVDISSVASLTPPPSSSDVSVITVDPPTGMLFAIHATGKLSTPGTPVNISVTATWNDGSMGPFSFTLPVDVVAGAAAGVKIVPGTPTTH